MSDAGTPSLRQWSTLAVAVLLLDVAITLHNVWPTPWVTWRHELSIDLFVLLGALVAWSSFVRAPGRAMRIALTAILLLLVIGRYADITAPALYGRPISFYWDAQYIPDVVAMLVEVAPWWLVAAIVLGSIALVGALWALLGSCVRRIAQAMGSVVERRALGTLAGAAVAFYVLAHAFGWTGRFWYAIPVSTLYLHQAEFLSDAYAGAADRELPNVPLPSSTVGRLAGGDFLLIFLESYGAATYDSADIANVVSPARDEFAAAVDASGRQVLSAFYTSPTFGGTSWLAHSSLMSGIEVRDAGQYQFLLTQQRETLPKRFKAEGYRAVAVMPGLRNPWPEGSYYGFDTIYGERDLDYRGPEFGWWRIPDQYAFAKLGVLETDRREREPLFVFMPTINTHIPFLPVPPYQPDWRRVLTPDAFDPQDVAASVARKPDFTHLSAAYADVFAYTFTMLSGYVPEHLPPRSLLVLLGDHQPAATVAGAGARWDVPVHIVTGDAEIAAKLQSAGFRIGVALAPGQPSLGTLPELTTLLLDALDGG